MHTYYNSQEKTVVLRRAKALGLLLFFWVKDSVENLKTTMGAVVNTG
jgi:hypothetical protein